MRPCLAILADGTDRVPHVTDDPQEAAALLAATLELGRNVGGVGRVLLVHPPEAETALAGKALGYRLWPADGASPGERYGNAFRQAGELGFEGAIVIGRDIPDAPPERLTEAAALLERHHGVVAGNGRGGIALLGLQRPEPTLFPAGSDVPDLETFLQRARQQLVRVEELDPLPSLATADPPHGEE